MSPIKIWGIALLGGIVPAVIWLLFWLREDKKRPEPRGRIILTFIAGMIAVAIVLPLENFVQDIVISPLLSLILLWAAIEEIVKYVLAYLVALRKRVTDEPVDAMIYMITVALGFAALENALFMFTPIEGGFFVEGLVTGNMRFIGATVLHTVTSAVVGASIALSFYKKKEIKTTYLSIGLILSIALHTFFNFFIMNATSNYIFLIFACVWVAVVGLILLFEYVKRIKPNNY